MYGALLLPTPYYFAKILLWIWGLHLYILLDVLGSLPKNSKERDHTPPKYTNQVELNCALTCFSIVLWIVHFTIIKVMVALLALLFSLSFCIAYLISFAIFLSIVALGKHSSKVTTCDIKWSINNFFLFVCLVGKWGKDNKLCRLITSWVKFCDVWSFSYIWIFGSYRFTTSSSSSTII
jgi:uncharacterized membrane protein